ncbi:EAL domain-containing protein [Enterobacter hormaechei subsp. hoffmannii]|uniref:EAL domain-containing protein n=1 Tax=Enterobacter hormaechei TaxID=158836 RepID=UPI0011E4420D|nr:EAL domain-containing protein [Enterobacter hormaechei]MBT1927185.1 EAL domain-containing protein [Enterobacter hormaechei subsp. hoffmannii]MBT1931971.1 EAL domain-containing protein [Enterobacter hormaechei subsp. hoffmannii]MBT1955586.1 EAL domain-containing protein [Enterobacter hormaechei subsp. hoffmannii]MBT1960330.1 EAL domain-containing protein [Enterobacter hormaechei subsp. hoffmannii]MBT1970190.1 EAL domain-containing protein [Enterobacter hormaechei subsp. hoffmannii]
MDTTFIADPIVSIDERLLGVELLTRFIASDGRPLHPEFVISSWDLDRKRLFLYEQCGNIATMQTWFERKNLFCTLNIDQKMAFLIRHDYILRQTFESMPFIKLELSEHFPGLDKGLKSPLLKSLSQGVNGLWLDDLGAGNANVVSLIEGYFEVVKIDRIFFNEQVKKPTFNQLIASIKKHCGKVIIEGIENREHLGILREVGVLGLQGYLFKSVPFKNVDLLL